MSEVRVGDAVKIPLACLQLGDAAYAVSIIEEIAERKGRNASHAAVCVALRRVVEPKLLYGDDPMPLLRDARDVLLAMWKGLEPARILRTVVAPERLDDVCGDFFRDRITDRGCSPDGRPPRLGVPGAWDEGQSC